MPAHTLATTMPSVLQTIPLTRWNALGGAACGGTASLTVDLIASDAFILAVDWRRRSWRPVPTVPYCNELVPSLLSMLELLWVWPPRWSVQFGDTVGAVSADSTRLSGSKTTDSGRAGPSGLHSKIQPNKRRHPGASAALDELAALFPSTRALRPTQLTMECVRACVRPLMTARGLAASTTTLLHENPRLRILDVRTQPGCTASARHSLPTVRWQVLDASAPTPLPAFCPAGTEVSITNRGELERRDMVFELLQEPRHSEAKVRQLVAASSWPTAPGQVMMLENDLVRMWDFRSSLGMDRQVCGGRSHCAATPSPSPARA